MLLDRFIMDDTSCDVNHLDADVLLPPRKRLLAGLKKQSLDIGQGSLSPSLPSCSSSSSPSSIFEAHLNSLMSADASNPGLTLKEITEASESAALTASDIAKAARAAAEEKSAIAVGKVVAAKRALDLVALFSEERIGDEGSPRKHKLKKQVPVDSLYRGRQQKATSSKTDDEIARKLHQVINSSPRIMKNPSTPDSAGNKHKNGDIPHDSLWNGFVNGDAVSEASRVVCNGHALASGLDSESYEEEYKTHDRDEKPYKRTMDRELQTDMDKVLDEKHIMTGKKRGRVKLKKLSLSICTSKDRSNMKDNTNHRILSNVPSSANVNSDMGSHCKESMLVDSPNKTVEASGKPFWRCQELETPPACGKRNKVSQ